MEKIILGALAMAALWRPLGLLHFLVCPTWLLQWGPPLTSELSKSKWFGAFLEDPSGDTNLDHAETKSVPMQRGARFAFYGSAPMQRGARF